jgi:hypothetical protein
LSAAERIEQAAEKVRARLAPMPTEGMHKTPEEMVDDLEWAKFGSGRIALVLKEAGALVKGSGRALAVARARAMQKATGKSADQREAQVVLAVLEEQQVFDDAVIAQEFAKAVARSVEESGSLTQTQASLVKAQMQLAGTGRES